MGIYWGVDSVPLWIIVYQIGGLNFMTKMWEMDICSLSDEISEFFRMSYG